MGGILYFGGGGILGLFFLVLLVPGGLCGQNDGYGQYHFEDTYHHHDFARCSPHHCRTYCSANVCVPSLQLYLIWTGIILGTVLCCMFFYCCCSLRNDRRGTVPPVRIVAQPVTGNGIGTSWVSTSPYNGRPPTAPPFVIPAEGGGGGDGTRDCPPPEYFPPPAYNDCVINVNSNEEGSRRNKF